MTRYAAFRLRAGRSAGAPALPALVAFGVRQVRLPVRGVPGGKRPVVHDQHVFGVVLLGGLGEIETAGYDRSPVDDYNLVVGYRVPGVYPSGDAHIDQKVGFAVVLRPLAPV